jgi:hypothetical protein
MTIAELPSNQKSGEILIKQKQLILTDAQIKALPSTPNIIIAAPGINKIILPISVVFITNIVSIYTNLNVNAAVQVSWNGSTSAGLTYSYIKDSNAGMLSSTGPGFFPQVLGTVGDGSGTNFPPAGDFTSFANKSFTIEGINGVDGNWTGGNILNTLKIVLFYAIL